MKILQSLVVLAQREGWRVVFQSLRHRLNERFYEWWFRVETYQEVQADELGFTSAENHWYAATDYHSLFKVLATLRPDSTHDVFVDYGSGKGRALIIAAAPGRFRRVIGVEISESLVAVARQNIHAALPRLRCKDIIVEQKGADQYQVPDDVTYAYFCNPFHGITLRETFRRLQESVLRRPRSIVIICRLPKQSAMERELLAYPFYGSKRTVEFNEALRYWIFEMNASTPKI